MSKCNEIVSFRGVLVTSSEVEQLKTIEEFIGRKFDSETMVFSIRNNNVSGIKLSYCDLSEICDSIGEFPLLKELDLSFNSLGI